MTTGKNLFIQYGLKKTSVDEIVKACGIAKGSFYAFFQSKEELYYAIMQEEEAFKEQKIQEMLASDQSPKELLKGLFELSFELLETNPFLKRIQQREEYELLIRKLPKETLESHIQADNDAGAALIKQWQQKHVIIDEDPEVIIGLLRSVMMLSMHRDEIGSKFVQVKDLLLECVTEGLLRK
ncbi:TetR/AcrR family transcriptional regulator [Paenibacillus alvei]|uniref:TetR/AcrR family transcriptional regulator n=1 Tax=Paenibacillus alvei TaxID=44250 RepID=A0ABT4GYH5_PAEAL|nr:MULTISPECIES: TetR/AcrR family transcriptional regulator [Paenibacillus]MCY9541188.1 TetR/AcrR family transcriptional regulator [Paenibacillus alvei]MCY9704541.1 TetR/AcrR family transcriptional regulator [Paenibacillus alvei]MCY9732799.1 TetR/AcrR family transcriptional regulator [Paenibacillus alvei]MCY9754881.1 TetR/AcrR family transcriptional regulator [Paenibacillus alvei]MCY9761760.1 TetR/AcrR family transcriptional regulator [Paenibacillus alvei]